MKKSWQLPLPLLFACHPERREGSASALAVAFAPAFLAVIPEGNLLFPL
jgi:hypothetical protein